MNLISLLSFFWSSFVVINGCNGFMNPLLSNLLALSGLNELPGNRPITLPICVFSCVQLPFEPVPLQCTNCSIMDPREDIVPITCFALCVSPINCPCQLNPLSVRTIGYNEHCLLLRSSHSSCANANLPIYEYIILVLQLESNSHEHLSRSSSSQGTFSLGRECWSKTLGRSIVAYSFQYASHQAKT